MQITIPQEDLLSSLERLLPVTDRKSSSRRILGHVLIRTQGNVLRLYGSDLEVGLRIDVPLTESHEDGEILVSCKQLLDIVKELPAEVVKIKKKDNSWLEITCRKSRFQIASGATSDYPSLPDFDHKTFYQANRKTMAEMLLKTEIAVCTDSARVNFNGIFFEETANGCFRMVALDGHRMAVIDRELFLSPPKLKRGILIPRKGLGEIKQLLASSDGETANIAFEEGYLFAQSGDMNLFVRLIDAEFTKYQSMIPAQYPHKLRIKREDFISGLRRVRLLSNERSRAIKMAINPTQLTLSSSGSESGEAQEEIDISFSGQNLEVGFNSQYLLDCLEVLSVEEVEMCLNEKISPSVLRGLEDNGYTYVIMPMRV